MNEELKQSVLDAAVLRVNAWIVSGGAILAGLSAYVEPALSIFGLILAAFLTYGHIKKLRVERQILYIQRDALLQKQEDREARKLAGLPCNRDDDDS